MKNYTYYDNKLEQDLEIKVGENAQENWDLISLSSKMDIWFHLDKYSSAHVVITLPQNKKIENISSSTISYACSLCKENSKRNKSPNICVIYTYIKYVKKGDEVGSVYTTHTRVKKI